MNIFGGQDHVRKLESQLKQKVVQMDNLDNALSVAKKELAEQRRAKELAEQELFSNAAKVAELEEQTDKLNKLVKQKNEYNFSLSSQLEAKSKEVQQREEDLQTEKATVYQMSKELEDERSHKKTLEAEVARVNGSFAQVEQKLKDLQRDRGREVDGLQDELLSAQHSLEQQRVQLQDAAVKMQCGQLDQENRGLSMDALRSKLNEAECTLVAERDRHNREIAALQAKCAQVNAKLAESCSNSDRLQNAASAADQKASDLSMELKAQNEAAQHAREPARDSVDVAKYEQEKEQLKHQVQSLTAKVKEAQDQVQQHQILVQNAASEVEALQQQVGVEKKHSSSLEMRLENMTLSLKKLQQQLQAAAAAHEAEQARARTDLEEAERRIDRLESDKKELVEEKQVLDTKLSRGSEAIKKVSKEQEKLENKLQKLASDRDTALAEKKELKAKITSLERDIVDMTRCNAKNKTDLDESRSRATMLEQELAGVRGQLAEAQLPSCSSPGSAALEAGGSKQRMALREKCTALDASLQQAKQDADNLRAQLQDEKAKQKQAQEALVAEQQYFMNKLADMEAITKGEAAGTPGGQLHCQIQSMKSRLSVAAESGNTGSVPPATRTPLRPRSSNITPRSRMSLASRGTELSLCTPRSNKAAQENAKFWHRKYEEQSAKVASLESMNRQQQLELLRSGGDGISLASISHPPQSHTPKLGAECKISWDADGHGHVTRELFGDMQSADGEENDAALDSTPAVCA